MSGQRVILLMALGAAIIAVVVAIAATCLDRPALREDVQASATAQAAQATPQAVAPTATPAPPTPVPVATFRNFAAEIDAALKSANVGFFRDRAVTQPVVCRPQDVPIQLGGPTCDFVGQEFPGFAYGRWRSEGSLLPVDSAMRQLERLWGEYVPGSTDQYGEGAPRVFATAANSDGSSAAIMTAMIRRPPDFGPGGPLRVVFVGHWQVDGGRWRMPYLLSAFVLGEDFLTTPGPDLAGRISNWERF